MAKSLISLFVVICVLQVTLSAKNPRAPKSQSNAFEELSKQTSEFVHMVGDQFNQLLTAKNSAELQAIFKTNTDQFVAKVTELAGNLQEQVKATTGDTNSVVGQAVLKLNQTIIDLQKQHPEVTARAKEVQENLQKGLKTVLAETDKVAQTIAENTKEIQDDVAKITKKAYGQVLETAKLLQKQLHEYAEKN